MLRNTPRERRYGLRGGAGPVGGTVVGVAIAFGALVCGAVVAVRGAGAGEGDGGDAVCTGVTMSGVTIGSGIVGVGIVNFASRFPFTSARFAINRHENDPLPEPLFACTSNPVVVRLSTYSPLLSLYSVRKTWYVSV